VRALVVATLALTACGGASGRRTTTSKAPPAVAETVADWMIAVLPEGPQIVVEVDLARLRTNAVVGQVAKSLLDTLAGEGRVPGLPLVVQGSPLATADVVVFGAYGVGTADAITLTVLATTDEVPGATRIAANLSVLGPEEWTGQVASRAAIAKLSPEVPVAAGARLPVTLAEELIRLRGHAVPKGAPGAVLRVTARLPFDARVALSRITGLEAAPAQLSVWADVVDDFALVLDADAADPGEKNPKAARKQLALALRKLLESLAREPELRAIGIAGNVAGARFVEQGTWVRAIIEVPPRQLARAADRARAMLVPPS